MEVWEDTSSEADIKKFEKIYVDSVSLNEGRANPKVQFEYGWVLVRSSNNDYVAEGLRMFEDLLKTDEDDMAKRDYLYYLSVANFKLKQYDRAISVIDALLRVEPSNQQALTLKSHIQDRMKRDGLIGAAVIGGGLLFGGAALAGLIAALATRKK